MATKLKGLRVDEGSLVDRGANAEAQIVLFKRDESDKTGDTEPKKDEETAESLLAKMFKFFKTDKKSKDTEEEEEDVDKIGGKILNNISAIIGIENKDKMPAIQAALSDYFIELTEQAKADGGTKEKKHEEKSNEVKTEKGSDSMPITDEVRDGLDDDVQKYLTELEKRTDDSDKVEELQAKVSELEKAAEDDTGEEEVDIWKGVSPEVKTQFEELQKKAETAEEVAKSEREKRVAKEYVDKAAQFPTIGSVEDVAAMLRQAYDISDESGEKLEKTFKAASEKIETNDQLTKEIGHAGDISGGDAWDKIEALADKLVEKSDDELSSEQAVSKILKTKQGKKLYDEYNTERSVN